MTISFPDVSGLSDGYQEIIDGKLYTLNKTSDTVFYWAASLASNPDDRYVNITGDNMTGPLGGVTDLTATNVDATTVEATNLTDGSETKAVSEVLMDLLKRFLQKLTLVLVLLMFSLALLSHQMLEELESCSIKSKPTDSKIY